MNPPEQAPALQQIYEARLELVRQNELEVADLRARLEQATRRTESLKAQMMLAKANYEEAASKIVDLLDDNNDEKVEEDDRNNRQGNGNGKHNLDTRKNKEETRKKPKRENDPLSANKEEETSVSQRRTKPSRFALKPTPSNYAQNVIANEVVELLDSDDENCACPDAKVVERRVGHLTRERKLGAKDNVKIVDNRGSDDEKKSQTNRRSRSSSTGSCGNRSSGEGKSEKAKKKRSSSSSSSSSSPTLSRRIKLRPRPSDIPPERWLKSSVGRTPQELNNINDMVQFMGSCQFGQSVVVSKFGKVHAIVLNDEWNTLAQRNDECQIWYVGLGPGRKRDARLVGASQSTIPIFHAPKVEYTTKELFYVGHYRVRGLEELDPPVVEMGKERDMRITFAFEKFDERLDSIIKRGPDR